VGLGDGSLHAMHLYGWGNEVGDSIEPQGFYAYTHDGGPESSNPECIDPPGPYPDNLYDLRRTLYSADGSYLKLEEGPNPDNEWIVSIPDGSQMRGTGFVANKFVDPNGNAVEFVNACSDINCWLPYTEIRDEFYDASGTPDRKIRIDYVEQPSGPSDHVITAPWQGGTATWTLDLEIISVDGGSKAYQRTEQDYPSENQDWIQPIFTRLHVVVAEVGYPTSATTTWSRVKIGCIQSWFSDG
jgi:hypothetical protein